jgi:hypothetical protein
LPLDIRTLQLLEAPVFLSKTRFRNQHSPGTAIPLGYNAVRSRDCCRKPSLDDPRHGFIGEPLSSQIAVAIDGHENGSAIAAPRGGCTEYQLFPCASGPVFERRKVPVIPSFTNSISCQVGRDELDRREASANSCHHRIRTRAPCVGDGWGTSALARNDPGLLAKSDPPICRNSGASAASWRNFEECCPTRIRVWDMHLDKDNHFGAARLRRG